MSFVAVLCHFCENDGPTVLVSTFIDASLRLDDDERLLLQNLNNLPELDVSLSSIKSSCEFCCSLSEQAPFVVSWPPGAANRDVTAANDSTAKLTFVSSRLPPGPLKETWSRSRFSIVLKPDWSA